MNLQCSNTKRVKKENVFSEEAIYNGMLGALTAGLLNVNRGETYFGYSMRNKNSNYSNYEKVQELEKILPYDIISVPAEEMDLSNLEFSKGYTGSSPQEALSYIKNAEFSAKPLLQKEMIFYSKNGKTYVDTRSGKIIRSFPRNGFKFEENKAMEEFE